MSKSSQPALKGFQCMAVYDAPQSAEEPQPRTQGKASKKSGKAAAAASAASAASSSDATATAASSSSAPLVRYLYYKSHSAAAGADDGLKAGCTLFVVNIPFHYTAEHLTQLFACFGSVEQVSFLQSHLSLRFDPAFTGAVEPSSFYRSAHVVYEQEESHDMAIKTDLAKTPQQCPEEAEDDANVGMRKWLSSYHSSHPQVSSLQLQVDKFMEGFDARSLAEKLDARKGSQKDADGWTLVKGSTRGKKRQMMQIDEETSRAAERANKKMKATTVVHFYRHQEREQKKERLVQLREKFEADKAKIAKMKQERKFRPY